MLDADTQVAVVDEWMRKMIARLRDAKSADAQDGCASARVAGSADAQDDCASA